MGTLHEQIGKDLAAVQRDAATAMEANAKATGDANAAGVEACMKVNIALVKAIATLAKEVDALKAEAERKR
jgi:hypothetical protein